jgi:hypothetical protein
LAHADPIAAFHEVGRLTNDSLNILAEVTDEIPFPVLRAERAGRADRQLLESVPELASTNLNSGLPVALEPPLSKHAYLPPSSLSSPIDERTFASPADSAGLICTVHSFEAIPQLRSQSGTASSVARSLKRNP